ncbi:MAG: hypothetical protein EOP63_00540 [Sphingomonadales bacterium]|nr:MAG: hypothetical protein EOP63_00540 [Sphingomonadales bacterium]
MIADFGWLAVAALAGPALLIALVPRRWLGRAMLGWAVMPLFVYIGVIVWESATRPDTRISLDDALLGFSLISAIAIIPWLTACAAGFALGFGLRTIFRRSSTASSPAAPPSAAPVANAAPLTGPLLRPAAPPSALAPSPLAGTAPLSPRVAAARSAPLAATPPPAAESLLSPDAQATEPHGAIRYDGADWEMAHIGFSGDGLRVGGRDVWTEEWKHVDTDPLQLPHPAHAGDLHRFTVQTIGEGATAARFAVSELSNGVYGFYVARGAAVPVSAVSGDGTLRYEKRYSTDRVAEGLSPEGWAVLTDVTTCAVLVDCQAWPASRIEGKANGTLFLWLTQDDGETLIRIDPAAQSFRNLGEAGADQPLADLSAYVDALRQTRVGQPPGYTYRRISPDGTIRTELEAVEWGNSHWVYSPRVIDIASGEIILDLWGSDWDATMSYPGSRRVRLDFRRYHFSGDLTIELDLADGRHRILREPGRTAPLPSGPLADARGAMEESGRRVAVFAAEQNAARPLWDDGVPASQFAAWRTAFVILFVAVVLIVVATLLSVGGSHQTAPAPVIIREIPKPDLSTRAFFKRDAKASVTGTHAAPDA